MEDLIPSWAQKVILGSQALGLLLAGAEVSVQVAQAWTGDVFPLLGLVGLLALGEMVVHKGHTPFVNN